VLYPFVPTAGPAAYNIIFGPESLQFATVHELEAARVSITSDSLGDLLSGVSNIINAFCSDTVLSGAPALLPYHYTRTRKAMSKLSPARILESD
jgi:hypothetical protein